MMSIDVQNATGIVAASRVGVPSKSRGYSWLTQAGTFTVATA
ncbi:hypothetical protein [Demequina sp.]